MTGKTITLIMLLFAAYVPAAPAQNGNVILDSVILLNAESVLQPRKLFTIPDKAEISMPLIDTAISKFKEAYEKEAVRACGFQSHVALSLDGRRAVVTITLCEREPVNTVIFEGAGLIPVDTLKTALYHTQGACFNSDSLASDKTRLENLYRQRGLAAVVGVEVAGGRTRRLIFSIIESDPRKPLAFHGTKRLKESFARRHFNAPPLPDAPALEQASDRLIRAYQREGFFDAVVSILPGADSTRIEIREGDVRRLDSISVSGNSRLSTDTLLLFAGFKPGVLFSQPALTDMALAMVAACAERGYPFAAITWTGLSVDSASVTARFTLAENGRYRIGAFTVSGLASTRFETLRRIARPNEGEFYRESDLQSIRERLIKSALFDRVDSVIITPRPGERLLDLSVSVQEAAHNSAEGVLGYAPEGVSGYFNLTLGNIAGTARRLSVRYFKESPLTDAGLEYTEPWIARSRASLTATLSLKVDESSYSLLNAGARLAYPFREWLTGWTGVAHLSHTAVSGPDSGAPPATRVTNSGVSGVDIDTRDRPDNPRRGFFLTLPLELGWRKGPAAQTRVIRTGPGAEAVVSLTGNHVLFLEIRYRGVFADDTAMPAAELPGLGGAGSLRGYRENQFYGYGTALARFEYRYLTGLRSRFTLFTDAGNADTRSPYFTHTRSLSKMLYAIGGGLQVETRAGLLGIDYGLPRGAPPLEGKIHVRLRNRF